VDLSRYLSAAGTNPPALPSSYSTGYPSGGNPATGTPATAPGPYWYYQVQAEMANVLSAAGITPSRTSLSQLSAAVTALAAAESDSRLNGNTTYVNPTTGNDSNDGTQAAPFATLDAAITAALTKRTPQRIHLAKGTAHTINLRHLTAKSTDLLIDGKRYDPNSASSIASVTQGTATYESGRLQAGFALGGGVLSFEHVAIRTAATAVPGVDTYYSAFIRGSGEVRIAAGEGGAVLGSLALDATDFVNVIEKQVLLTAAIPITRPGAGKFVTMADTGMLTLMARSVTIPGGSYFPDDLIMGIQRLTAGNTSTAAINVFSNLRMVR
jgi:hypothetical protein